MKKLLCAGAMLASFAAIQSASAADLALKAPPPAPIYSWTGFYLGANVGYSWGKAKSVYDDPNFPNFGASALNRLQLAG
jgi:outer membrane immunogenic protein